MPSGLLRACFYKRSTGRADKAPSRGSFGRQPPWPACGVTRGEPTTHVNYLLRFIVVSPRGSRRPISKRQKRWSTICDDTKTEERGYGRRRAFSEPSPFFRSRKDRLTTSTRSPKGAYRL